MKQFAFVNLVCGGVLAVAGLAAFLLHPERSVAVLLYPLLGVLLLFFSPAIGRGSRRAANAVMVILALLLIMSIVHFSTMVRPDAELAVHPQKLLNRLALIFLLLGLACMADMAAYAVAFVRRKRALQESPYS